MSVATSILSIGVVLVLALIFTVLAFNWKRVLKVGAYTIAMVLWFTLSVMYPTFDSTYYFVGWVFMMPAIFTMLLMANGIYDTYKHATMEDWQKDESWEED